MLSISQRTNRTVGVVSKQKNIIKYKLVYYKDINLYNEYHFEVGKLT